MSIDRPDRTVSGSVQPHREQKMLWKYRTILFELTKDGLLGDRYVDDE